MNGPNMKRAAVLLAATAATALVAAAPAAAAPDFNTTLSDSSREFKWDGSPAGTGFVLVTPSSIPCKTPGIHDCDHVLIKTEVAGGLKIATTASGPGTVDVDIRLYKSNAAGEPGAEVASGPGAFNAEESLSANVTAGAYYLFEVDFALKAGPNYAGTATLTPRAGAAPAPGADAAPAVGIARFAAKQKAGKLKGFAGTASDDKGISKVELAVVQVKGKKCSELDAKGKLRKAKCNAPAFKLPASGTSSWSLKLKKKLKKGSYVLYARAVDTAGQKSAVASQKFKVT